MQQGPRHSLRLAIYIEINLINIDIKNIDRYFVDIIKIEVQKSHEWGWARYDVGIH